ncbi:MAG TPA: heavy metal sensor histidine kinase [Burkholderiales bacterium]|nr:heavy metal sensor histidine kinase [Burkholderiales bacterium]
MTRSIAIRLAAMFAVAALGVFSLVGWGLYRVLEKELAQHQIAELTTRFEVLESLIRRAATVERWKIVHTKLDSITPETGSARFWIFSDDPNFRYGDGLEDVKRHVANADGFGALPIAGKSYPMKTLVTTIAANEARPTVRFMIGIDTTPFFHTLRTFAAALVALSAAGVVLVTLVGYWIARVGLKPLNQLSQEANALSPSARSQRLQFSPLPSELLDFVSSFNGALDRLENAYARLEAFNADVAHELRTPLTNLIGQTQVALSRQRTAPHFEEVLQSNLEEMERLRAIINDMLFLARADQGETATGLASTSIAYEINKTVEFLEFILDEAGVTVTVSGDAEAMIETSLFRRAMTNLLQNAVQHSPTGSEILVEVSQWQESIRVAVSNPGKEIAEEHLGRLFDRFYRVDPARRNSWESHGLGLSIVKAVAQMHGGSVFASSNHLLTTVGFNVARRGEV